MHVSIVESPALLHRCFVLLALLSLHASSFYMKKINTCYTGLQIHSASPTPRMQKMAQVGRDSVHVFVILQSREIHACHIWSMCMCLKAATFGPFYMGKWAWGVGAIPTTDSLIGPLLHDQVGSSARQLFISFRMRWEEMFTCAPPWSRLATMKQIQRRWQQMNPYNAHCIQTHLQIQHLFSSWTAFLK